MIKILRQKYIMNNSQFNWGVKFYYKKSHDKIHSGCDLQSTTSLDFNYVKPCFDLLQFKYNLITLGQKDSLKTNNL